MESTGVSTMSGGVAVGLSDNLGEVASSPSYQKTASPVTRNAVPLGSLEERLAIMQQAAANYQKAGGRLLVTYNAARDVLVIALPEVGQCVECGSWFSGNDGCQHCVKRTAESP